MVWDLRCIGTNHRSRSLDDGDTRQAVILDLRSRPVEQVSIKQIDQYRSYFSCPHLDMVLSSMIAGNTEGELWSIPQEAAPPLLLLWDKGNDVFYFGGDCRSQSSFDALAGVVASQVRPRAIAARVTRVKARGLSPSLEGRVPELFPGLHLRESKTLFLVDDAARSLSVTPAHVPGIVLVPITPEVLKPGALGSNDSVRAEIHSMWRSEERFYEHGFGTVAVLDGDIICWCTSEYVSPGYCGIGIETSPCFERRGVATATASHFIQEARRRGVTACWECDVTNHGSVRVAEKLRLVRLAEETYWIGALG